MTIQQLQEIFDSFKHKQQEFPQEGTSLHEKLFLAYNRWVLDQVESLVGVEKTPLPLAQALQGFLNENWSLVRGTCLCPTAIPAADVTELLCSVAEFVAANLTPDKPVSALHLLMPSINDDCYADLDSMPLREVIRTHILGRDGEFLLPVKLLTEIDIENPDTRILQNRYYVGDVHELYYTNDEELKRLINHNALTRALGEALRQYDVLSSDTSNLLGQLQLLCRHLQLNSAHGGRGVQENAASGAYAPIIEFNNYYTRLDESLKNKIPAKLKAEIDKLLNLASNPSANINATANLETCIGTRGAQLVTEMRNQEEALSAITISPEHKSGLVAQAKAQVIKTQEELKIAFSTEQYTDGKDDLALNLKLLNLLNVVITINSMSDLKALEKLSAEELDNVLESELVRANMVKTLGNLENLIIYFTETLAPKIEIIMRRCADEITKRFITREGGLSRVDNFRALLMVLSFEKCTAVCQGMQAHLRGIIQTADDFSSVLEHLNPEQRTAVFQGMQAHLPGMIKTVNDLNRVLNRLNPDQCTTVVQGMMAHLPGIIRSAYDFSLVLEHLNPEQCTAVFQGVMAHFPGIIDDAVDFNWVLNRLNPEQRTAVYQGMQARLPGIIKHTFDFSLVLKYLNPEQCTAVCQGMKAHLPGIIRSTGDFLWVLEHLNPDQRIAFCQGMQMHLPDIILTADNLRRVLNPLDPEQRTAVFQGMKAHLPDIIRSANNFLSVLEHLNPEQCTVVVQAMCSPKDHARFQALWDAPLPTRSNTNIDHRLLRVAKLLNDYTDGGSRLKQILFFHTGRHYVAEAASLVRDIHGGRIKDEKDLQQRLIRILSSKKCNLKGYFFKCIGFIASQLQQPSSAEASPATAYKKT